MIFRSRKLAKPARPAYLVCSGGLSPTIRPGRIYISDF